MRTEISRSALMAIALAGCTPTLPFADCGDATADDCALVVNAALGVLANQPDRLIVAGSGPNFVVIACSPDGAAPVDVLIDEDSAVDAVVRERGPNLVHLCAPGASPP